MKKLLIALMLICGTAHAQEEWWESANESGGKIVLLGYECSSRPEQKTLKRMYAAHKSGQTTWGCWNFWSDQVHVVYDDGASYTYDPALFVRKVKK
jgi:hypothetical protein